MLYTSGEAGWVPSTYGDLRPARSWSGDVAGLGDRSNAALVNAYHFDEPEKRRAAVSNISRVALDVDDFRLLVAALDLGDVVEELRAERHPPAEPVPADPVAFGRELLESHWLTRSSGGRQSHRWDALHYAALSDAQLAELGETSRVDGPLVLACGRRVNEAEVPSLSDR